MSTHNLHFHEEIKKYYDNALAYIELWITAGFLPVLHWLSLWGDITNSRMLNVFTASGIIWEKHNMNWSWGRYFWFWMSKLDSEINRFTTCWYDGINVLPYNKTWHLMIYKEAQTWYIDLSIVIIVAIFRPFLLVWVFRRGTHYLPCFPVVSFRLVHMVYQETSFIVGRSAMITWLSYEMLKKERTSRA